MIKLFKSYSQIESICKRYGIVNWELNPQTSLVDVGGSVDMTKKGLEKIPIKFGKVEGNFYCWNNQLTSLEGAPLSVGGNFSCNGNQLTSLEGAPKSVGGDFSCGGNKLTSLEGAPNSVGCDFYCTFNKLTSLQGAPLSVGGDFSCRDNQLTSLEGAPKSVGGHFNCVNNKLTSLEGAPKSVGGGFNCSDNQIRDFLVPYGSINESKEFNCEGNPIFEIYQLFNDPKCVDIINEWEILDGKKIVQIRLEEVFLDIGLEIPEGLEFKEWELV
jgi:hypothetical protein